MFEFELPDVGEGVAEGEIVTWLVNVGDTVSEDQVLAEVETDKAVVDLPSPTAGTVVERHAEAGDVVPVGSVVVTIDDGDENGASAVEQSESAGENEEGDADTNAATPGAPGGRVFAPPSARRLARELGVDVAAVAGSGPGGRVTKADVREAAADDEASEPTTAEASDEPERKSAVRKVSETESEPTSAVRTVEEGPDEEPAGRDRTLAAPATRRLAEEEGVSLDDVPTDERRDGRAYVEPEDVRAYAQSKRSDETKADTDAAAAVETDEPTTAVTREPYRGIRRTIGERMVESVSTAPHVSHHDTAVVSELVETRAQLKPAAEKRDVSLTYLPFVMKAVVAGLEAVPIMNSSLDETAGEIHIKHDYNIGVAVATDAGLLVPVVDDVDEKGLLELATEIWELGERARERELDREQMQGGTFTITNFGAIGGEYATPIINQPETAILGLGAIEQRPTVEDGAVVARHTLPLSLSIDHRVIDGAEAAEFVNTVIEYLETPSLLLLE
jgi:pyruvate dehydrogenase E2 component (dihydrolipoamide acetyltransferase)